jgi:WD40 repeat protein
MLAKSVSGHNLIAIAGILVLGLAACQVSGSLPPRTRDGLIVTFRGHTGTVSCVTFSPDGSTLASSSLDKTVRLWNIAEGKGTVAVYEHSNEVYAVAFSPNGALLASATGDSWAPLGPLRFGENSRSRTPAVADETPVPFMVILWNTATSTEQMHWETKAPVFTVAFAPDGRIVAAGSEDFRREMDDVLWLWNAATGELEATLAERKGAAIWSIAFSPDGRTLALGSERGVALWDVPTGKVRASLGTDMIRSVAFSPDGTWLASGTADGALRLWNMLTNREQAVKDKHRGIVYSLAFSPDGTILASGGQDGVVRLWNTTTADIVATIRIPQTWVTSVAFSPDGALLATGSSDNLIRLWNVEQVLGQ